MAAQLGLFAENHPSFGRRCATLLRDEKLAKGSLSWERVTEIIEAELSRSYTAEKVMKISATKRSELFDALVRACGGDPAEMTKDAQRPTAVALANIRKATPLVDAPELKRRAAAYVRKYPGAACTPSALATHWHALGNGAINGNKPDLYAVPADWRERFAKHFPAIVLPPDRRWSDLGTDIRARLLST